MLKPRSKQRPSAVFDRAFVPRSPLFLHKIICCPTKATYLVVHFVLFGPINKTRRTEENPIRMTSNSPDYEGKKTVVMDSDSLTRSTSDDQHFPLENIQEKQNSIRRCQMATGTNTL